MVSTICINCQLIKCFSDSQCQVQSAFCDASAIMLSKLSVVLVIEPNYIIFYFLFIFIAITYINLPYFCITTITVYFVYVYNFHSIILLLYHSALEHLLVNFMLYKIKCYLLLYSNLIWYKQSQHLHTKQNICKPWPIL